MTHLDVKTDRRQRTRKVEGVTLTQSGAGAWTTPDGFVFRYDEHDRAWWLSRTDAKPVWWGCGIGAGAAFRREITGFTLVRSIAKGIRALATIEGFGEWEA